jgi:hemerythrin
MDLIKWKNEYAVDVAEIDEQHRHLIGLINRLGDAMSVNKGCEVVDAVLAELVSYTTYHFDAEERLFLQHGYDEREEHRKAHAELAAGVRELSDAARRDDRKRSIEVMLFLSDWLNRHILDEDRKFGEYVKGKGGEGP